MPQRRTVLPRGNKGDDSKAGIPHGRTPRHGVPSTGFCGHSNDQLAPLIAPYAANSMQCWTVSTIVGDPKNETPELIKSVK
ncbi:MAG: hypothetical protein ACREVA_04085 [Burkholderiales bacterium]